MGENSESVECKRVNLEVTRYFMSIGEAMRLVIQAGAMAKGGCLSVGYGTTGEDRRIGWTDD